MMSVLFVLIVHPQAAVQFTRQSSLTEGASFASCAYKGLSNF